MACQANLCLCIRTPIEMFNNVHNRNKLETIISCKMYKQTVIQTSNRILVSGKNKLWLHETSCINLRKFKKYKSDLLFRINP